MARAARVVLVLLVLVVGGLLALAYVGYRRDITPAFERIAAGSRIAQTRCGPIEYADAGEGPPLLVVHGAGGGFDQGLDFAAPLVRSGLRVIAVSRFGYLRTPLPADASAAAQADAHVCLLDALNIERAAVLGMSAGGPSTMQLAVRHPQRVSALVLVVPAAWVPRAGDAPSVRIPPGTAFLFDSALKSDFLFWFASRFARDTFIRSILGTPPEVVRNASADEQARVQMMLEHILPVSPRRLGLLNDAAVIGSMTRYPLERITAPALLLSTPDDLYGTFDGARYTASQVPGARFVGYASGGHLLVGHQQESVAEIVGFLK